MAFAMSANAIVESILQVLSAGILIGCLYGLMCTGLGVIFGVMRVINFAQGDLMMVGMYTAYFCFTAGLSTVLGAYAGAYVAVLCAGPALFALGYLIHLFLVSHVSGLRAIQHEGEGHHAQLMLTLGVALVLQNTGLILFGSEPKAIQTRLSSSAWALDAFDDVSVFVNKSRLLAAIISVAIAVALFAFINRARIGKSLRAAADNPQAAIYMGIDVDRAHRIAFALGSAATGIAGRLVATFYPFQPYIGFEYVIVMYAGVVFGGMGSIAGAFWGGLAIGLVQQLSTLLLPIQLQNTAIFVIFLLVIFLRPRGFFGRVAERT